MKTFIIFIIVFVGFMCWLTTQTFHKRFANKHEFMITAEVRYERNHANIGYWTAPDSKEWKIQNISPNSFGNPDRLGVTYAKIIQISDFDYPTEEAQNRYVAEQLKTCDLPWTDMPDWKLLEKQIGSYGWLVKPDENGNWK